LFIGQYAVLDMAVKSMAFSFLEIVYLTGPIS